MTDEIQETGVVEVTQTVEVTQEPAATGESVIDWDAAANQATVVVAETSVATSTSPEQDAATYYAPRGKWDFTDSQRIVISVLLWLNIIVFVVGYLAITGQLTV